MPVLKIVIGFVLFSVGLLWSLQGEDLIRMKPILCVANCEPLVGGSMAWLIVGIVTMAVGLGLLVTSKRKRHPSENSGQ